MLLNHLDLVQAEEKPIWEDAALSSPFDLDVLTYTPSSEFRNGNFK